MAFVPSNTLLGEVDELENLEFIISYSDLLGNQELVTIQAQIDNNTINIENNIISGYFSDVFDNEIYYRTIFEDAQLDELKMVNYFQDLPKDQQYRIYYCKIDTTPYKIFTYTAETSSDSQEYTIQVNNDWTRMRNLLKQYLSPEEFEGIKWINTNGEVVQWVNVDGNIIPWSN